MRIIITWLALEAPTVILTRMIGESRGHKTYKEHVLSVVIWVHSSSEEEEVNADDIKKYLIKYVLFLI